jgi:hypothetical protein
VRQPWPAEGTDFVLVRLEEQRAVFENLEHDFPKRIIYEREGDHLTSRIEGKVDRQSRSREWMWELVE